jgi:hypothetical protein
MLLTDYVRLEDGTGKSLTEIHRISDVSWKTVIKAGTHGLPVMAEVAEKLSEATGGRCSVPEIREPRKFMTAAQRAEFEAKDRLRARTKNKRAGKRAA